MSRIFQSNSSNNIPAPPPLPPPLKSALSSGSPSNRSVKISGSPESRKGSLSASGSPKSSSSDSRRKPESSRSESSKISRASNISTLQVPPPLPLYPNESSDEDTPPSPKSSKRSMLESGSPKYSSSDARRMSKSAKSDSSKRSGSTKVSTLYIPPLSNSSSNSDKGTANSREESVPDSGSPKSSSSIAKPMSESAKSESSKRTGGGAKVSVPLSSSSKYAPRPQPDSPRPVTPRNSNDSYVEPEVTRNDVPFFEDEDCIDPEDAYKFPCCVPPHSPRYPPNPRPPQEWDPSFLPASTNIPESIGTLCRRCGKEVYLAEMHLSSRGAYHTECYKCCLCGKSLDSMSVAEYKGEVFCKGCYRRNFATQGTGFGVGAGVLQTR